MVRKTLALFVLSFALQATSWAHADSAESEWVLVAQEDMLADVPLDKMIALEKPGKYNAIKLEVTGGSVRVSDARLQYNSWITWDVEDLNGDYDSGSEKTANFDRHSLRYIHFLAQRLDEPHGVIHLSVSVRK